MECIKYTDSYEKMTGLKKYRENVLHLSRKAFAETHNKKYCEIYNATQGIFTENSIKNWERGRSMPGSRDLFAICNCLGCDIDFLFGRIDCKTHDSSFVHSYTGISEKAIERLKMLNDHKSELINCEEFLELYSEFITDFGIIGLCSSCLKPAIDAEAGFYNEDLFDDAEEAKKYYQYQIAGEIHRFINRVIEREAKEGLANGEYKEN